MARQRLKFFGGRVMGFAVSSFLASAINCAAQADFNWNHESNKLGAADRFGFASWSAPLTSLTLQGFTIPLQASFTSDTRPAPTPSPLGRGWFIPFFGSALIEEGQSTLRWLRPDGVVFYYSKQRGNSLGKPLGAEAPIEFLSREGAWRAIKVGKKRVYRLTHQKSGVELVYEDARLVRFCLARPGEGVDSYSISYNRLLRPARLSVFGSGRVIAELIYDDASRAKELSLGEATGTDATKITFAYADLALNQFPSGPYLSRIGGADTQLPVINAVRKPSIFTPLSITYQSEGTTANRIRFEKLTAGGGNTGLLWDGKSGFIREDDGAVYKVENPSLANAGRPSPSPSEAKLAGDTKKPTEVADYNWSPDEAKITRTDREGKSEFRFNDRSKGIFTTTDKNGVTTLTHYLLTPGPMMNKVRKVEEIRGKETTVVTRNAYDDMGRQVRQISGSGQVSVWEYLEEGKYVRKITDGQITQELRYDQSKRLLDNKLYKSSGSENYQYAYAGDLKTVKFSKDGTEVWNKVYEEGKGVIEYTKASGEKFTWSYQLENGANIVKQANPDGSISQLKN